MPSHFSGHGKITFKSGKELQCKFAIQQKDSADIIVEINTIGNYIEVTSEISSISGSGIQTVKLSGQTSDGFTLADTDITISGLHGNSSLGLADLTGIANSIHLISTSTKTEKYFLCHLTNLLFYGIDWSPKGTGSTRDKFTASLLGRDCQFRMLDEPHILSDSLNVTQIQVTSTLKIPFQSGDSLKSIQEFLDDICSLVSFAQGCFVSCLRIDEFDIDESVKAIHLLDSMTRPYVAGFPVIAHNSPTEPHLRLFLEGSLAGFQANKNNLQLFAFLAYYLEALLHHTKSIKFLLASITAESIKSNFQTWQHLPDKSFHQLLTDTFTHFDLTGEDFSFIVFRNNVVHTGDDQLTLANFWREYSKLLNQLQRLFMKICGYTGKYVDFTDNFALKSV